MNNIKLSELKDRLSQIIGIETIDINKFIDELLSFFSESEKDYIVRRHSELQKEGYKNKEIYPMLSDELTTYLFIGRKLSQRQIKRTIYKE